MNSTSIQENISMHRFNLSPKAALLAVVLFFASAAARAGDGHDHGEAAAAAAGPALSRFTASSELFELVGVLKGRQLTLYWTTRTAMPRSRTPSSSWSSARVS